MVYETRGAGAMKPPPPETQKEVAPSILDIVQKRMDDAVAEMQRLIWADLDSRKGLEEEGPAVGE